MNDTCADLMRYMGVRLGWERGVNNTDRLGGGGDVVLGYASPQKRDFVCSLLHMWKVYQAMTRNDEHIKQCTSFLVRIRACNLCIICQYMFACFWKSICPSTPFHCS